MGLLPPRRGAAPVAEVENVPTDGPMDINTAVRMVLKKALQHDGLARGLHEGARAIEKGQVCMWKHYFRQREAVRCGRHQQLCDLFALLVPAGPAVHPV